MATKMIILVLCLIAGQVGAQCKFGPGCTFACHCKYGDVCNQSTGNCQRGCSDGNPAQLYHEGAWSGAACQFGNVAFGKAATQGPETTENRGAGLLVDGKLDATNYAQSRDTEAAWWQVDLGELHVIYHLVVPGTFTSPPNFHVLVGNTTGTTGHASCVNVQGSSSFVILGPSAATLKCKVPLLGRYVSIVTNQAGNIYMSLPEIQVFGFQVGQCPSEMYGPGCLSGCNCDDACQENTGICPGECKAGYKKDPALLICVPGAQCKFGPGCTFACHCKYGDVCDQSTGKCHRGCSDGNPAQLYHEGAWSGAACQFGNVAFGKAATQGPETTENRGAGLLVDGKLDATNYAQSRDTEAAWWQVDLGKLHVIYHLVVPGTFNSPPNFHVRVGNTTGTTGHASCVNVQGSSSLVVLGPSAATLKCTVPLLGRYVSIVTNQAGRVYMSLPEIQVFGFQVGQCPSEMYGPGCLSGCNCDDACQENTGICPGECKAGYKKDPALLICVPVAASTSRAEQGSEIGSLFTISLVFSIYF